VHVLIIKLSFFNNLRMHSIQSTRLVFYKRQQSFICVRNLLLQLSSSVIYFKQLWFSYTIMNIHIYTFSFFFEGTTSHSTTRQISICLNYSTHPSFLTYFRLPSYPSSARLSWSANYIGLTPNRTRKWKCRYLDQASLAGN
jgi:hypothetical protein